MGSYDTSEYTYTPRRQVSETRPDPAPSVPMPRRSESSTPPAPQQSQGGTRNAPAYNRPAPQAAYNPGVPTIAALGGGLTPARIVKELPPEIREKSIKEIADYLMSAEVVSTKEESAIVEAIKDRQSRADYRAVVNNFYNLHCSKLPSEAGPSYYQAKEIRNEGGSKSVNFLDIAIISHDEGGRGSSRLEKICS